ncbi:MAG: AAA family ATPase [Nitrososphaerota archaeon]
MLSAYPSSFDVLYTLTGNHLCEIYGPYGTGKSRLLHHICLEAQRAGKRVLYIDTEAGLREEDAKLLKNYWYVGDELEALQEAVAWAKDHRNEFDVLAVDSLGHVVYVSYIEFQGLSEKLQAFQRLALIFRDMVRFARGERNVDFDPKNPFASKRRGLAIAINHPVSEFARISKDLPPEEPLAPMGGQIHRVPKVILRVETEHLAEDKSSFGIFTFKLRDMPRNIKIGRYIIDSSGVHIEWSPRILSIIGAAQAAPTKLTEEAILEPLKPFKDLITIEETANSTIVKLKQYLSLDLFTKLHETIRALGGEYVSQEKIFRIPKKTFA